eukprot:3020-Heterococcus_DN1.PRE.2
MNSTNNSSGYMHSNATIRAEHFSELKAINLVHALAACAHGHRKVAKETYYYYYTATATTAAAAAATAATACSVSTSSSASFLFHASSVLLLSAAPVVKVVAEAATEVTHYAIPLKDKQVLRYSVHEVPSPHQVHKCNIASAKT